MSCFTAHNALHVASSTASVALAGAFVGPIGAGAGALAGAVAGCVGVGLHQLQIQAHHNVPNKDFSTNVLALSILATFGALFVAALAVGVPGAFGVAFVTAIWSGLFSIPIAWATELLRAACQPPQETIA